MSFADLKRKSQNNFSFLQKELEKSSTGKQVDERFWKPEVDASGNGYAVIRFLPAPDGEDLPWVKMYSHAFQGPGGWYIENSLTTLNQKDPCSEFNTSLWNSGVESDKQIARNQKRKLAFYSNIYVVKDPSNPENEGKVFLYKFGKKIFDKIMGAMQPEFEDETPLNPFDFWQGADFKVKIKKVAGYWNYDSSEFAAAAPLLKDDDALEQLWKKEYSLSEIVAADQFKTYDELKKRLESVLRLNQTTATSPVLDEEAELEDLSEGRSPVANTPTEDDALSYFQKLAEE